MAKRALCIGINDYPGTQSDLRGSINDASDWQQALERRGFHTRRLLDNQASKERLVDAISRLVDETAAGDLAFVTYSGHGTWIPDTGGDELDRREDCLCPHDVAQNRPLTSDELFDLLAQRKPGARIALLIDACHTGTVARFAPTPRAPGDSTPRVRFLPPETFLPTDQRATAARLARPYPAGKLRHGALLLSSCQETEYSYEASFDGRPGGAFSHVAVKVLGSLRPGASFQDWFQAIRESLPSSAFPQTPQLAGSRSQKRWPILD
jgi:metacaspase-1